MNTPVSKANIFNTALPVAEASLIPTDIAPIYDPGYLLVYFWSSVSGILRFARTTAGVTVAEDMNGEVAIPAANGMPFVIPWRAGDSGNFRYSVTTGNYTLLVEEVG